MTVVKFPYSASRRVYSRRPRVSKNGSPEERAAKAAAPAERKRSNKDDIRDRVRLIAAERNIPASEIKWIGRLKTYDGVRFAEKYDVSLDWLLCGDLKGLLRTVRGCPTRPHLTPELDERSLGAVADHAISLAKEGT